MESLFSPCTRYQDVLESRGDLEERFIFKELNLDVSTEELLSAQRAFTFADLHAMLVNRNTILWLTPHTAIVRTYVAHIYRYFYRLLWKIDAPDE
jgi:hypothetical protein